MTTVRVRGIYATALTDRLAATDHEVVAASDAICERFDREFDDGPAAVAIETTADRQGVWVAGDPDGVESVVADLADVGVDALTVDEPAANGAVFDGRVTETLGGGAVVDLGDREGYLPFDAADGYVDVGDSVRVQVRDPAPPWARDRPTLGTDLQVGGAILSLVRGQSGVTADLPEERATELARTAELLSASAPEGWGVHWERDAADADLGALDDALADAAARARTLDGALDEAVDVDHSDPPSAVAAPAGGQWVWFGRESRFALDRRRRSVVPTMAGHHRIKAGARGASDAVDFVEAVCDPPDPGAEGLDDPDAGFPFGAVTGQFGPREGDRVTIAHGKPDGRMIVLGRAAVTDREDDGQVTLRRELSSSGIYDGLGTEREPGDVAITRITEGRWWYPTVYRGEDGERKGTYVNVCTPVEVFPDAVRYVDLHVDVVRRPDGTVQRVDDDELDAAVAAGQVSERLADRARDVAATLTDAL